MTFRRGKEHTLGTGFCAKKAPRPPSISKLRGISPAGIMLCDWTCQDYRMCAMQSTLKSVGVRGWRHTTSGAFFTQNFLCTLSLVGATNMPVLLHHLGLPGRPCARRHHTIGDHMHRGRGKSGGFFHAEPGLGSPCRHSKVCAATCSGQARAVAPAVCLRSSPAARWPHT